MVRSHRHTAHTRLNRPNGEKEEKHDGYVSRNMEQMHEFQMDLDLDLDLEVLLLAVYQDALSVAQSDADQSDVCAAMGMVAFKAGDMEDAKSALFKGSVSSLPHNNHISDSIEAMAFKLGMTVDLYMAYMLMLYFNELDLDARSQRVGKGKNSGLNYLASN